MEKSSNGSGFPSLPSPSGSTGHGLVHQWWTTSARSARSRRAAHSIRVYDSLSHTVLSSSPARSLSTVLSPEAARSLSTVLSSATARSPSAALSPISARSPEHGTLFQDGSLLFDGTLTAIGSLCSLGPLKWLGSLRSFGTLQRFGSLYSYGALATNGSLPLSGTLRWCGSLISCGPLTFDGSLCVLGALSCLGSLPSTEPSVLSARSTSTGSHLIRLALSRRNSRPLRLSNLLMPHHLLAMRRCSHSGTRITTG